MIILHKNENMIDETIDFNSDGSGSQEMAHEKTITDGSFYTWQDAYYDFIIR